MRRALIAWTTFLALLGPAATAAAAPPSPVDADALAALNRMGAELRTHQNISLKSDVTMEDVLDNGQKLQYTGTVEIQAHRPDRFKIAISSDLKNRQVYYDGKSVTVFSPRLGLYASFPAPDTIGKTLAKANDEYGIELPLSDLFAWGTDPALPARLKEGFLVNEGEHVGGQACNHYAFRQQNVDWQVWIAQSGPALPCKLVITDRSDPAAPQYTAVTHWSFPGAIPDTVFAFAAPANTHKIVMAKANGGTQ
jgi:hypothetical protein